VTGLAGQVAGLHRAFSEAGIPHAFGGALALAFCIDQARATSDIDVNVFVAPSEAARVFSALPEGVRVTATDRRQAERDGQVRLWWDSTPVDVFFAYHPFHEHAATRTREVPFVEGTIPVLDCTDLTLFKAFFNRTRDWADIEAMAASRTVDADEADRWVTTLLGDDSDEAVRLRATLAAPPADEPPPRLPR
jgi:hypothetical protein